MLGSRPVKSRLSQRGNCTRTNPNTASQILLPEYGGRRTEVIPLANWGVYAEIMAITLRLKPVAITLRLKPEVEAKLVTLAKANGLPWTSI